MKGLSLFSSAGIGETYLDQYVEMKVANELLKDRSKLYKHFYPEVDMITGDITDNKIFDKIVSKSLQEKVDFVYATPPCQSFSKAGKQAKNDERDMLFLYVVKIVEKVRPTYVLIENVPEFVKLVVSGDKKVLDIIKDRLGENYKINWDILNTGEYGTPQTRKRSIILLSDKSVDEWLIPTKSSKIEDMTVEKSIGHLPRLESGERSDIHKYHYAKNHNGNHILWMSHTPTGKTAFDNDIYYPQKDGRKIRGYRTTYKRMSWDKPCPTITMANGSVSSQNNVHPGRLLENGLYSDARVLTIYELMILTGLPSEWGIPSWASDSLIRKVLGECVPPILIKKLVENLTIF